MSEQSATEDATEESVSGSESARMEVDLSDEDDTEFVEVEHAPPRMSQGIAMGAFVLGVLVTAPFVTFAIPFGLAGIAIVSASLFYLHSREWLSLGTASILVGAVISGAYGGVPPELMLVGVGATVLAWDVGQNGIVVGEQLGRQVRSGRLQLVHVAISTIVVVSLSAIAYIVYLFAVSDRHAAAVATVVIGAILTAWLFRD